jgi:hypothetical protein
VNGEEQDLTNLSDLYADAANFAKLTTAELFDIDYDEVAKLQLHHFKNRFQHLRKTVSALDRLADDVEIDEVTSLDDLATLIFPHTIYKSYAVSAVDNNRYDLLTRWLQSLTAHDLSKVDLTGCDNLDDWMGRIEAVTPVRPVTSSGTSGKISVFPRSTFEETYFLENTIRLLDPYKDERTVNIRTGNVPILNPWPARRGRHNLPITFRLMRDLIFSGREDMLITLDDKFMGAEALWLTGKLRRADNLGEKLVLTPREQTLKQSLAVSAKDDTTLWDRFIEKAVVGKKGQTVVLFGVWIQLHQLATACKERGVKIEWAPDSVLMTGGGTKGFNFPDGWETLIDETFSRYYPARQMYGTSETTAAMIACQAKGNLHPLPWGVQHVVDPDSGQAFPRTGVQRGRLLIFDTLPTSYWSGTATGDEVTVHWDGGCECGRKGPYFENNIQRLSDTRGGDDKITCARTPQAFERLEEYLAQ